MQKAVYEFISQKTNDPIIERRTCAVSGIEFPIYQSDKDFYEKISPVFNGKKYHIPFPNLCPEERQRRRLVFRNDRSLYKTTCAFSGKSIMSIHDPVYGYTVYDQDVRWSDKWNALDYGRDFDFSRSFFEQFQELLKVVPRRNIVIDDMCENCQYSNQDTNCKNCYLLFSSSTSEDCLYGNRVNYAHDCLDTLLVKNCRNCYECVDIFDCEKCLYCSQSTQCNNSMFLYNCTGCTDCMFCVNLVNKQYRLWNKQYTKEEYHQEIQKKYTGSYKNLQVYKQKFEEFQKKYPRKAMNCISCDQVYGNNVYNSQNGFMVFDGENVQDCKYAYFLDDAKDCMDITYGCDNTILHYDVSTGGINSYQVGFCVDVWPNVRHSWYCDTCTNIEHCFGCVGLKNKSFCILNKQYTKTEYEELVPKIIMHMQNTPYPGLPNVSEWGELFSPDLSPFGYNETVAQEYFPLSQDETKKRGYVRHLDKETNTPTGSSVLSGDLMPEDIRDVDQEILTRVLVCEKSGKPFRIVKQELDFYKKMELPLPRRHPDVRHVERLSQRPGRDLFLRRCDACHKESVSVYPEDSDFKVYCKECYKKEIY